MDKDHVYLRSLKREQETEINLQNIYCGMEQLVARRAHNPKVVGSSPAPATKKRLSILLTTFFCFRETLETRFLKFSKQKNEDCLATSPFLCKALFFGPTNVCESFQLPLLVKKSDHLIALFFALLLMDKKRCAELVEVFILSGMKRSRRESSSAKPV